MNTPHQYRLFAFVLAIIVAFSITPCLSQTQDTTTNISKDEPQYEMKTYYLVLLYRGPNRSQDSVTVQKLQEGHMANIKRLAAEGKLVIAGPFLDDTDLRGIFIFTADSLEEVQQLCDTDPAIQAGRLRAEIHPWMSARGSKLP